MSERTASVWVELFYPLSSENLAAKLEPKSVHFEIVGKFEIFDKPPGSGLSDPPFLEMTMTIGNFLRGDSQLLAEICQGVQNALVQVEVSIHTPGEVNQYGCRRKSIETDTNEGGRFEVKGPFWCRRTFKLD